MYDGSRGSSAHDSGAGSSSASPGKRSLTSQLPARAAAGAAAAPAVAEGPVQALAAVEDVFALHLLGGELEGKPAAPHQVAEAGMTGNAGSLPYLDTIQSAFGPHDVSSVPAFVGGPAAQASQQLGATAYAAGGGVAFGGAPDLHTAAHEAAHVVQQRGGVQLSGGVGAKGDRYEQHADAVADRVVRGESAAPLLDEMSGGGGGGAAGGGGVQRYDSPHHIELGDSVAGESVTIKGVPFTPGELAAIADYVGPAEILYTYEAPVLASMKALLRAGIEDTAQWDALTNGGYSKLAQANEDHFAPGGDGRDFVTCFVDLMGTAMQTGQAAKGNAEEIGRARTQLYSAEHYLEDAFSAGHQIASLDVETAVDAVLGTMEMGLILPLIAAEVFRQKSDVIKNYAWDFGIPGVAPDPIDEEGEFQRLATMGALFNDITAGPRPGIHDAVRKFVHEKLDESGVEVQSLVHPEPWIIHGDHTLNDKDQGDDTTILAIQAALIEVRKTFEDSLTTPVPDAHGKAENLMARHRPIPTPDGGSKRIGEALAAATSSETAIVQAVAFSMAAEIKSAMDIACATLGVLVCLDPQPDAPKEFPDIPPSEISPPEQPPSYIPAPPSSGMPTDRPYGPQPSHHYEKPSSGEGTAEASGVQLAEPEVAPAPEAAPAPAPAPAPASTDASLPTTVEGWKQALADAAIRSRDELLSLIDRGGQAAMAALPTVGSAVLDTLWPTDTGWRFSGKLQLAGFAGVGFGLTAAGSGNVSMTIMRSGSTVELEVTADGGGGVSGGEHFGLDGDLGVIPVRGATKVTLETDIAKLAWPTAMLDGLRQLDPRAAMQGMFAVGADFWKNTKVSAHVEEGMDLTAQGGIGSPAAAEGSIGGSAGVTAGGDFTFNTDGSQVRELTVDVGAAASVAAEISPTARDVLSTLQEYLGVASPGLAPLSRPIDPDAPALRDGDVLPGPSDSGTSLNGEAKVGVKIRRTIPADGSPDVWEGGFAASAEAVLAVLGQSVGGGVAAEEMYPWADFERICQQAVENAGKGVLGAASPAAPINVTPSDWSVTGKLSLGIADLTQCAAFPGLDVGSLPGIADRMDSARAELEVEFKWDTALIPGTPPGDIAPLLERALALAEQGKIVDAVLMLVNSLQTLTGTAPRLVLDFILKRLELEISTTDEAFADGDTPGFGVVPGAKGVAGVSQSDVYKFSYDSGSPELSPMALGKLLADLVF